MKRLAIMAVLALGLALLSAGDTQAKQPEPVICEFVVLAEVEETKVTGYIEITGDAMRVFLDSDGKPKEVEFLAWGCQE